MNTTKELPDDRKFARTFWRDILMFFLVNVIVIMGIIVTLWISVKYDL